MRVRPAGRWLVVRESEAGDRFFANDGIVLDAGPDADLYEQGDRVVWAAGRPGSPARISSPVEGVVLVHESYVAAVVEEDAWQDALIEGS